MIVIDAATSQRYWNGIRVEDDAHLMQMMRASMSASPAQVRRALHRLGRLAEVNAIAASDPEAAIVWEYATVIERQSPFIAALGAGAFTPEQIDDVFALAVTL
jgi:hypothetical protein